MNTLNMEMTVEEIRPSGIIYPMPDLDEMITTREAWELAQEMGDDITQDGITSAARSGRILGAQKLWNNQKAPWVFTRESFLYWLENRRSPGRPPKNSD
ncbi:MAG: hypothetical protein KC441_05345 [Anaerolineales bacterium]|nr:hypothetical protein [Anaerolineales bacterium]